MEATRHAETPHTQPHNVSESRQGSRQATSGSEEHQGGKVRRRVRPRASKETPPLVLIEWEDAAHNRGGWKRYDDSGTELGIVRSVGWLVQRDARFVWLIPHMMPESETMHAQGCGDMTIPASCIRRIVPVEPVGG